MIFFTKCRKQPYRVKSTAVSELWFFTSVENSRTFLKKITKYVKYEDTFWLQKSFIAHTTSQIWKPALRYEKKIDFEKLIFFIFFTKYENSRTFWQIWKPALRYEKKRHIFCRIGRIRLRIAWVTIWSIAHLSRRVSDNSQKKKFQKFWLIRLSVEPPCHYQKVIQGRKFFFAQTFS